MALIVTFLSSIAILGVGAAMAVYICKQRKLQKRRASNDVKKWVKTVPNNSIHFKFSVIEKATEHFANANKLGQGGFGTVYKGALADGREIAVKRLFFNNKHRAQNFYNEINIISSVQHNNLVRLLGCSCSGPESLLVYEFLPNQSLDRFIFDPNRGKTLNWEKRHKIIIGTAEGLVHLHENSNIRIIHRDIKASNILLDSRFCAKIADFGLARSFKADESHINTAIAGTLGYMAPEYIAYGQLTERADVYGFGVLLLEIITGRQNNRRENFEESLITIVSFIKLCIFSDISISIILQFPGLIMLGEQVWQHFQQHTAEEVFDPNLMLQDLPGSYTTNEILRVVQIGLLCIQETPSLRPTMSKALHMLRNKKDELPTPMKPPFMGEETMQFYDASDNLCFPLNATACTSNATISHSSFYPR
ncbi:cysteine-rich receptor-like protein kinase 2 [Malania oleifera]|uniref:cysteine-rich receptor-like protein kinase 2 n=1 Tax=Malania oleifera TaxID=397392 RepID=UPI0025ADD4FB|nr:cysteine-rich receptor-like protein kinase 2 [Malania oleifera]